jgi:hypothetical protein
MQKYKAKPQIIDNVRFASKHEARRYEMLKLMLQAGAIKDLVLQPKFEVLPGYVKNGKKIRAIHYVADFMYETEAGTVVGDAKGFKTKEYLLKKKMFEYRYPYTLSEV